MCSSSQCKINSLRGMLLHLAEGPAQLTAQYWFSYNQVSITLSKPHKVKGFRCGLLVSPCILSTHNMLHLCIPACATLKKEWLLPHYCVKKLDHFGSFWEKKVKQTHKKKRTLLCSLAFVSRVVDVFFCGGVRMYVTQASSIFCAMSFFFLWPDHTHMHTQMKVSWSVAGSVQRGAGPPHESAAICFKSSSMNNGEGVLVKVEAGVQGGGQHKRKMESIISRLEAGLTQRDFHVLCLAGDKATNRAQTLNPVPPEAADSLTSSLIYMSCVLKSDC